jgi:hypothetical protein
LVVPDCSRKSINRLKYGGFFIVSLPGLFRPIR